MDEDFAPLPLGLTEAEAARQFDALQRKLVPLWQSIRHFNHAGPADDRRRAVGQHRCRRPWRPAAGARRALSLPPAAAASAAGAARSTSRRRRFTPTVVDYYLDLLPGVFSGHARKRLFLVSPLDGSAAPLTQKLLERPRLHRADPVAHSRSRSRAPRAVQHDRDWSATWRSRSASRCTAPIRSTSISARRAARGGSSRKRACRIRSGVEDLTTTGDLADAIARCGARKPSIAQVVAKLNEGVSGDGNATSISSALPRAGRSPRERAAVLERVDGDAVRVADDDATTAIAPKLAEHGGIVEELIAGREFRSPSAQLRVTPLGEVERSRRTTSCSAVRAARPISGCRFPASPEYAAGDHARGAEGRPPPEARGRARPVRARLRRRCATSRTSGRSTPSKSTCARAGRRIRS